MMNTPKVLSLLVFSGSLFCLLLSGCGSDGSAAPTNVHVTGIVTDAVTQQPITGARVADHLYNGTPNRLCQESWTNTSGKYDLPTWYEEHTLVCSAPGYIPLLVGFKTKVVSSESQVTLPIALHKKQENPSSDSTQSKK